MALEQENIIIDTEGVLMNYKDPTLHGKIMRKIRERCQPYYTGKDCTVYVKWSGVWTPYHDVAKLDKRLQINE